MIDDEARERMKEEYGNASQGYEGERSRGGKNIVQDTLFIDMRVEGNTVYIPRIVLLRMRGGR